MKWLGLAIVACLGFLAWVRLAPLDAARWHVIPEDVQNQNLSGAAMRIFEGSAKDFSQLSGLINQTPRARLIAGSLQEGMVTYEIRSAVMGFPDYTTIRLAGTQIAIYARLRYGKSDFGVNAARVDRWLDALTQRR